ncbi:hypothetical protein [Thiohalomonas denitrificans]|uniref:hypothetical protein n=1 Tax=Thiohalomonas denitrificans TaxID=415747 RepID=UPI0026F054A5|nr:hypothetical protein [Thiohalomonas denitrificans]
MDTLRVDISYRPLRIAWAIRAGDFDAYRKAIRYSSALWGGRFNPIIVVDHESASQLIDLFRVDFIFPVGESGELNDFTKKYPHLINPLHGPIFVEKTEHYPPYANVLDVRNALAHWREKLGRTPVINKGARLRRWRPDDPLSDILLAQLGDYPSVEEVGTDYRSLLLEVSEGNDSTLEITQPVPADVIQHSGIWHLSRVGLERHYSPGAGRDSPGFFVGSAADFDDLVCHWNLRACDIPLWFIDPNHIGRYAELIPSWEKAMREMVAGYRHEWDRRVAIWTRREDLEDACKPFGNAGFLRCRVTDHTWNGRNVRAPMMHFGYASALGVLGGEGGKPKVSFALPEKPFCGDISFSRQNLVASMSLIGALYGDEQHTFHPPYIPELNEFYGRTMHFLYDRVRVEPERIGLVIDAADRDTFLYALPVGELTERVFDLAGYAAKLSPAGLVTRQLIARLGGIHGARVFKIPGVRRLLKTHGPGGAFTKRSALQIIGCKDPHRPDVTFNDFDDLYIEPRPPGEKLKQDAVFGYLVEKGLFRIGVELVCPSCRMGTWTSLDALKQRVVCDLCGYEHDASRQLTDSNEWHFRRSGVFGAEKNALGAVPVSLTLDYLGEEFGGGLHEGSYSPSLDLKPKDGSGAKSEVDFVWIIPRAYPRKTVVILGECKDQGPISSQDIQILRAIADALPRKRFKTFVVLSQLAPFSRELTQAAKSLNDEYRRRVILLTDRELELERIRRLAKNEQKKLVSGFSPEDMSDLTTEIYFTEEKA